MNVLPVISLVSIFILLLVSYLVVSNMDQEKEENTEAAEKKSLSQTSPNSVSAGIKAIFTLLLIGIVMFCAIKWSLTYNQLKNFRKRVATMEQHEETVNPDYAFSVASDIERFGDKQKNDKSIYELASRLYALSSKKGSEWGSFAQFKLLRNKLNKDASEYLPYLELSAKQGSLNGQYELAQHYYQTARNNEDGKKKKKSLMNKSYKLIKQVQKKDSALAEKLLNDDDYLYNIVTLNLTPEDRKRVQIPVLTAITKQVKDELVTLASHFGPLIEQYSICRFPNPAKITLSIYGTPEYLKEFSWKRGEDDSWYSYKRINSYLVKYALYGEIGISGAIYDYRDKRKVVDLSYVFQSGNIFCTKFNNSPSFWEDICKSLPGSHVHPQDLTSSLYVLPAGRSYRIPSRLECKELIAD